MKKKLKFILIILVIVFNKLLSQSCDITLNGEVEDFDSGEHLEYTTIYLIEIEKGIVSDEHGKFKMPALCPGNYTLKISHIGCPDTLIKINLSQDKKIKIRIPHMLKELESIEIKEHFENINIQTLSTITQLNLDQSKGKSLGDALKNIAGVTSLNSGANISKPIIHGLQGYRIMILNNGVRQEGQNWGNEHAPEIDPFIGQKISVLKGASAIRYGNDALGGVVLVEPNDLPDSARIKGEINLVGFSNGRQGISSGILEGSIKKIKGLSWRLQGTIKKGGNQFTPEYILKNTGLEEKNFSYALGYHRRKLGIDFFYSQFNSQIGIFSGAHIGNLTDLKNAFQQNKPADSLANFSYELQRPMQQISHELIKTNMHLHTGLRSTLRIQYSWQYNIRKEFDKDKSLNDSLAALNKPDLDYRLTTQNTELVWEHFNIRSFRGIFGAQYMNQKNIYLGRYLVPNFIHHTWGVFGIERYVKAHFEIEFGLRYDERYLKSYFYKNNEIQSPSLKFNNLSGNIGYAFKPDSVTKLLVNLSSSWRGPAVNELYSNGLHHGVGAIERGNDNLKTEHCQSVIISFLHSNPGSLNTEVSIYTNYFQNYIYQEPGKIPELTLKGAFPVFNFTQTDALFYGFDLLVRKTIGELVEIENKFSLVRAKNLKTQEHLIFIPADRNQLTINLLIPETKILKDNRLSLMWNLVNKQWRIPENMDFASPPEAYHLFGIDVSSSIQINNQKIILGIGANNLLNSKYRDYLDRFRYYSDAIGRNLQVRIKIPINEKKK